MSLQDSTTMRWRCAYGDKPRKDTEDIVTACCGFIVGWTYVRAKFKDGKFLNMHDEELHPSHWCELTMPIDDCECLSCNGE